MKIWEIINIVLLVFVSGLFWGPWLALSRSMSTFTPEVFLAIVHRMDRNMSSVMTVLFPLALLSTVPVLILSFNERRETFYLTLAALALFIVTLLVTMLVEVPIVAQIRTWTMATLPSNWQRLRDRWGAFHYVRTIPSIVGLVFLLVAAVLY